MKSFLSRLAALLVAAAAGCLALEGLTRLTVGRGGRNYGIEMWRYAKELKRESANPAIGHEHRPNTQARIMGVDVRINGDGLRDREVPVSKEAGVHRILALGDSMTFGFGTPQDETWPEVLEQLLADDPPDPSVRRWEVINAGVGNYNTSQELAWLEQRGFDYAPDRVVLGYYLNDAEETPHLKQGWWRRHSELLVLAASTWDGIQRLLGLRPGYREYYFALYGEEREGWRRCRRSLERLAADCRKRGVRLVALLIPELHEVGGARYVFSPIHDTVRGVLESLGVPVIDPVGAFRGIEPDTLWVSRGDAHPSVRAHAIFAREVHRWMLREARRGGAEPVDGGPKVPPGGTTSGG